MKKTNFILFIFLLTSLACTSDNKQDSNDFDRNALLSNYANNIIVPRYENLDNEVNDLYNQLSVFKASINQQNFEALQTQFSKTYKAWQACTPFEFGPAGMLAMKATFNTYPCDTNKIKQNISSGSYNLATSSNISATGLPALDFLLFTYDEVYFQNNTATLTYVNDIINQLKTISNTVLSDWNTNYKTQFTEANGTDIGSSIALLVNEMNFDFEKFIRDGKVGIPLGVRSLGIPQPEKVEAFFSKKSLPLLKESILQFRDLYNGISITGTNGIGFDDYLTTLGAKHQNEDLNTRINQQLNTIVDKVNSLDNAIDEEITTNTANVQALYDEMQKLIVYIKVDLSSSIGVLISYQDNDGD